MSYTTFLSSITCFSCLSLGQKGSHPSRISTLRGVCWFLLCFVQLQDALKCQHCKKQFKSKAGLNYHTMAEHVNKVRAVPCVLCFCFKMLPHVPHQQNLNSAPWICIMSLAVQSHNSPPPALPLAELVLCGIGIGTDQEALDRLIKLFLSSHWLPGLHLVSSELLGQLLGWCNSKKTPFLGLTLGLTLTWPTIELLQVCVDSLLLLGFHHDKETNVSLTLRRPPLLKTLSWDATQPHHTTASLYRLLFFKGLCASGLYYILLQLILQVI